VAAFRPAALPRRGSWDWRHSPARPSDARGVSLAARGHGAAGLAEAAQAAVDVGGPPAGARVPSRIDAAGPDPRAPPPGAARAQVHETYIVAQTRDGIVIVDQHAAHERIVYERLKAALASAGIARQILLIPEIVELDPADVERLNARAGELARY